MLNNEYFLYNITTPNLFSTDMSIKGDKKITNSKSSKVLHYNTKLNCYGNGIKYLYT